MFSTDRCRVAREAFMPYNNTRVILRLVCGAYYEHLRYVLFVYVCVRRGIIKYSIS